MRVSKVCTVQVVKGTNSIGQVFKTNLLENADILHMFRKCKISILKQVNINDLYYKLYDCEFKFFLIVS